MLGGPESPGQLWFRGEYERALVLALRERNLSASFRDFGMSVTTSYRLGQIYHSLGDYAKAADLLTRNVMQLEGDLRVQSWLGDLHTPTSRRVDPVLAQRFKKLVHHADL